MPVARRAVVITLCPLTLAAPSSALAGFIPDQPLQIRTYVECPPSKSTATKKGTTVVIQVEGGDGQVPPEFITSWSGVLQVRLVSGPAAGFGVTKGALTDAEAYGAGRPNGYTGVGYAGPYTGMMWPYRDAADFFDGSAAFNGNDIGTVQNLGAGLFRIGTPGGPLGALQPMQGEAVGGPLETRPGAPLGLDRYQRGIPGNGVAAGIGVFGIDLLIEDGQQRTVEVSFVGGTGTVSVLDTASGVRRLVNNVPIDPAPIRFTIPAPGAAGTLALGGLLAARRRRRA